MKNIRGLVSCLLSASLIQFNFVSVSFAAPDEGNSPTERAQQLFDILRPARMQETISEAFYRAVPYLDEQSVAIVTKQLDGVAAQKTPDMALSGDTIIMKGPAGKELRMRLSGTAKALEFSVNGEKFSRDEMENADLRFKKLKAIAQKNSPEQPKADAKKHSLLWPLLLPEAHADIGSSFTDGGWMWGLGGLALGGIVTYMFMKNQEEKKIKKLEAALAASQCADPTPSCCIFNGAYMPYQNGCCQMLGAGAARVSVGACPGTLPFNGSALATPSPVTTTPGTFTTTTTGYTTGIPVTTTLSTKTVAPKATYRTIQRTPTNSGGQQ